MKTVGTKAPQRKTSPVKEPPPQKRNMRPMLLRGLMILAFVLILLIPSYIAISDYLINKNNPANSKTPQYTSARLEGPSGKTQTSAPDEDGTWRLFDILGPLIENGERVSAIPSDFQRSYSLTLTSNSGTENFLFYCNVSICDLYFEDASGNCYRASIKDAALFLNSIYAFELYPQSAPPVLTTAATDEIIPSEITWHYRSQNDEYTDRIGLETTTETKVYPIANDIGFTFSLQPSTYTIRVVQNGKTHTYLNQGSFSLPQLNERDELDMEITATYERDALSPYYGEIVYRFRMNVVEAAKFTVVNRDFYEGGYFLLSCQNVKNAEKLVVNLSPAAGNPVIFRRDGLVFAAIPAGGNGEKELAVSYGTIGETFRLTVLPAGVRDHVAKASELRGDLAALAKALDSLIPEKLTPTADNTITPTERFADYTKGGAVRVFGYGDRLTVSDTEPITLPFELYSDIRTVTAMACGTVRDAGEDPLLGKYVILDNGCGLFTWYCGLSEIRVEIGSIVATGDALGLAGKSGFGPADTNCVMVLTTLGNTVISPEALRRSPYMY